MRTHVKAFTKIVSVDRNYPTKSTRTGSKSLLSSNLGCSRSCSPVPDLDLISISSCASVDETSSTVSFSSISRRTIFNSFWLSNKSQSLPSFDSPVDSSIEVTDRPTIKSSDNKFGYENMLDECEEKGSKEGRHRMSTKKSSSHRSIFGADLISTSMPELEKFSVRPDFRKTVSTSALLKRSGKCSSCLRSSCLRSPSGKCLQSELNKSVSFDPMVAIVVFIEPKERPTVLFELEDPKEENILEKDINLVHRMMKEDSHCGLAIVCSAGQFGVPPELFRAFVGTNVTSSQRP
eukprot:scaffold28063_cov52-Attheya_sp.AAC.2